MSELFQTEESLSPELQWLSEAKRSGITTEKRDGLFLAAYGSAWDTGETEIEAVDNFCEAFECFPTFDQWKLERAKR